MCFIFGIMDDTARFSTSFFFPIALFAFFARFFIILLVIKASSPFPVVYFLHKTVLFRNSR